MYKKQGEATYTVDLSTLRHKTSRFYGPTIHMLPEAIQPWVEEYERSIELEYKPDHVYLFPMATDWSRGHSSSSWTALVKACFLRHAGIATPPKQLRASFCTYLRSADGVDDELLESCAKAMKHLKATGGSGARFLCTTPPRSIELTCCAHVGRQLRQRSSRSPTRQGTLVLRVGRQ